MSINFLFGLISAPNKRKKEISMKAYKSDEDKIV